MAKVPEEEKNMAILGERPMTIVRRMIRERERMLGMTDEERAWRKKWLEAQELAPEEPVTPPGYFEEMYNPIRRLYLRPMNHVENKLANIVGKNVAYVTRHYITKTLTGIAALYWAYYHLKYHSMDWTRKGGWSVLVTRPMKYPDNKDMSLLNRVNGNQFYVNKFDKSPI